MKRCDLQITYLMYRFGKHQLIYDVIRKNRGAFIISEVTGVKSWLGVPPSDSLFSIHENYQCLIKFNVTL